MTELNLAAAHRVTAGAFSRADELGIAITATLVGPDGAPVLVERMDAARAVTVKLSIGKARAAAAWGQPSADLAQRFQAVPALTTALVEQFGGEFVAVGGGVPVLVDGVTVGAVGISGGTADQDVSCANAGLARLTVGDQ